jgi:hypothetical protein
MQQLSLGRDDCKRGRQQSEDAHAAFNRDDAGQGCAQDLTAASKALCVYLQANRACECGDEAPRPADSQPRKIGECSANASYLESPPRTSEHT